MTQNLFFLMCLTGLLPVAVSILRTIPKYELMQVKQVTWADAQNYCRMKYTDLATILSDTHWLRLNKVIASAGLTSPAWVGLYDDIKSWRWSLNELPLKNVPYAYWYPGQPDNLKGKGCACGIIGMGYKWWDVQCTLLYIFICYDENFSGDAKFIGVPIKMTWFGAQTYCRTHHTDLASSLNSSDNDILSNIKDGQGDSWIGLYRETWKWSDGSNATNLPWAPGAPDNAAGNENCAVVYNDQFSDEPCTNLHYFFCHADFPIRRQTVRVQVNSDGSVFNPAVQSSILEQIKQKLKEKGMLENTTVSWKVQPDGNIFHKKKKDEL